MKQTTIAICTSCKIELSSDNCFYTSKLKVKLRSKCKNCIYLETKDKRKEYREKHKEVLSSKNKEWILANTEHRKEYKRSKEQKIKRNTSRNVRYANDINFNITHRLRSRLQTIIREINYNKESNTLSYVGCNKDELKTHIENQFVENMAWDNRHLWHIDHIIPCCSFDFTKEEQIKECFNYKNLRPLWAIDNLNKIKTDIKCKTHK